MDPAAAGLDKSVRDAVFFQLNEGLHQSIIENASTLLTLEIPNRSETFSLKLYRADVLTPEFRVLAASDRNTPFPYQRGVYYWGVVNDDPGSIAALTFSKNEMTGFIFYKNETYNLGKRSDVSTDMYILFKETDILTTSPFDCGVDESFEDMGSHEVQDNAGPDNCVHMYIEVDYDIFVGKGGVQ